MGLESIETFNGRKKMKEDHTYKNILLIPNLLTKTFMNLLSTKPYTIAKEFFEQVYHYNSQIID
jgi:hypothetical protein